MTNTCKPEIRRPNQPVGVVLFSNSLASKKRSRCLGTRSPSRFAKLSMHDSRVSVLSAVASAPLSSGRRVSWIRWHAARAKAAVNAPHSRRFAHTEIPIVRTSDLDCARPLALFHPFKVLLAVLLTVGLVGPVSASPMSVTVTITNSPGPAIPADFSGLSFGAVAEMPGHGGVPGYLFCATNRQLVTLFKNSGLHNLRLGGTTVEGTNAAVPDRVAIDNLFAFAKAAGVKVLYSLPLLNGNSATNAATARYIWGHYQPLLEYFALGNEPDVKRYLYPPFGMGTDPAITNYACYLYNWRLLAAWILNVVPEAKFAGPDAAGRSWAATFAMGQAHSGMVSLITQHYYVGGRPFIGEGPEKLPVQTAIDNILSTNWVAVKYPAFYEATLAPVQKYGLPYRLTEANDYLKGIENASDSFATISTTPNGLRQIRCILTPLPRVARSTPRHTGSRHLNWAARAVWNRWRFPTRTASILAPMPLEMRPFFALP